MARILLIDDEQDLLDTLGVLLKHEGHEIVPVRDGLEAMDLLRSLEEFDLLVTDIRMAPVDGLEIIACARKERPAMDIVVVSAYLDADTIQKAEDMGCSVYIKKPFTLNDILDPIREILLQHKQGKTKTKPTDADEWVV